MKRLIFLALAFALGFAITYFVFRPQNEQAEQGLKVAASISPAYSMLQNVGGDRITMVQILPPGVNPHTYEPSASDQVRLQGTDLAFLIGAELDTWAERMMDSAASGYKKVYLSEGITLLPSSDEDEPGDDPHYWLSYSNAETMVALIARELSALDPENADYYRNNADQYTQSLRSARQESAEKLNNLSTRQLITFHSAFNYLAAEFDLEILASIEPFPGQEPTPQYLAEVGALIQEYQVTALFREPDLSDAVVKALADDYNITVYTLDPEGGLKNDYLEMMAYNIDTIATALK
jgi:zinc transport system substrate-binding protein